MVDEVDELYGDMDETDRLLYGVSSSQSKEKKGEIIFFACKYLIILGEGAYARKKKRHGAVQAARGGIVTTQC